MQSQKLDPHIPPVQVEGITLAIMRQALSQARTGIKHILGEMDKCQPAPRRALSPHAPAIARCEVGLHPDSQL